MFTSTHPHVFLVALIVPPQHRNVTECLNPPPIRFPDDIDHTGRFANLVGTNHRLMEETEDFEVALKRVMMPSCTSNIFNLEEQRALAPRAFHFYVHYADGKIGKVFPARRMALRDDDHPPRVLVLPHPCASYIDLHSQAPTCGATIIRGTIHPRRVRFPFLTNHLQ